MARYKLKTMVVILLISNIFQGCNGPKSEKKASISYQIEKNASVDLHRNTENATSGFDCEENQHAVFLNRTIKNKADLPDHLRKTIEKYSQVKSGLDFYQDYSGDRFPEPEFVQVVITFNDSITAAQALSVLDLHGSIIRDTEEYYSAPWVVRPVENFRAVVLDSLKTALSDNSLEFADFLDKPDGILVFFARCVTTETADSIKNELLKQGIMAVVGIARNIETDI